MKLSIIIVNFNRREMLSGLLESIKENVKDIPYEVIVVDNGSSDRSPEMVKENFPDAILIKKDRNIGCCPAYNAGYEKSKGEYVCLMHEDVVIHKNTIQKLIEFLHVNSRVGYVGPKNLDEHGDVLKTIEKFHTPIYDVFFSYKHLFSKIYYKFVQRRTKTFIKKPVKVDWMQMSCLMIRRAALEKIGLFDSDIIQWWDDPQIQLKMHRAGWEGYYIPDAKITHYGGLTKEKRHISDKVTPAELLWIYSKYIYFRKFYGPLGLFVVKCNDSIIFAIYLLINLFKYYAISKDIDTKWEINRRIEYLKFVFNVKKKPNLDF